MHVGPANPEEIIHSSGSVIMLVPVYPEEINHGSGSVMSLESLGWELPLAVFTQKIYTINERTYLK